MALLDIEKTDFVDYVHGSVPLDRLPEYYDESKERVNLILLTVMNWATDKSQSTGVNLYMSFYHVADWMKMAYFDRLISEKQREHMKNLNFEDLLELVWETAQVARFDAREVSEYLRTHLPT